MTLFQGPPETPNPPGPARPAYESPLPKGADDDHRCRAHPLRGPLPRQRPHEHRGPARGRQPAREPRPLADARSSLDAAYPTRRPGPADRGVCDSTQPTMGRFHRPLQESVVPTTPTVAEREILAAIALGRPLRPIPVPSVRPWAGRRLASNAGEVESSVGELWLVGPDSGVTSVEPDRPVTLDRLAALARASLGGERGVRPPAPRF